MLLLAGVPVRRGQQRHLEWVLDNGHLATIGPAGQLEDGPKSRERDVLPFPRLDDRHTDQILIDHLPSSSARPGYLALLYLVIASSSRCSAAP
jgi:hypothetical protein